MNLNSCLLPFLFLIAEIKIDITILIIKLINQNIAFLNKKVIFYLKYFWKRELWFIKTIELTLNLYRNQKKYELLHMKICLYFLKMIIYLSLVQNFNLDPLLFYIQTLSRYTVYSKIKIKQVWLHILLGYHIPSEVYKIPV